VTTTSESPSRPLRRDAARNRRALLDAGREVFAARGLEATLDEVARAAGVGVGTAYRHFANKQELAAAIFSDDFEQLVESANGALDIDDPWEALVTFIETTVAKHAKDRGLYEVMMDSGPAIEKPVHSHGKVETMREALIGPITALVDHAKAAGCLRADVSPTDVAAIFLMMGSTYSPSDAVGRPVWRRYLWLLLDGLRATSCPQLPVTALVEHAKKAGCLRSDVSPTDVAAILLMMGTTFVTSEAVGRPVWRRYLWLLLDGLRATSCPKLPVKALEVDELDAAFAAAEKHKKH